MAATAMKLTDQITLHPNASISGRNGTVVDTGIDLHWPGPGRVYLHPREVAEAVRVSHGLDEVADVLKAIGWVPGGEHESVVADLKAEAEAAVAKAAELEQQLSAALATISLVPAVETTPVEPAAKPTRKKTEAKT